MKHDPATYDSAWQLKKSGHPATQRFNAEVAELAEAEGLQFDTAWGETKRRNPSLYGQMQAANESALPRGAELSADGQRLVGNWPVPATVLASLGLPLTASREQFEIFKAASKVTELEPEVAAKCIVFLVQHGQLTQGVPFDALLASVRKHFPLLFVAVKKVSSVAAVNELQAFTEAVNAP